METGAAHTSNNPINLPIHDLLHPFLASQRFLLLDGALATELEQRGASLNDPLWSAKLLLENPNLIRQVHLSYLGAGADIITTASYQATYQGFAERGIGAETAARLLRLSATVAVEARSLFLEKNKNNKGRLQPLVAASVGPYGAYLADGSEYSGNYKIDKTALKDFHRKRLHVLENAGADLLLFETVPSLVEAKAMIELLNEKAGLPAMLSFSCRNGAAISDGSPLAAAIKLAGGCDRIVAIGVNCTAPQFILPLLKIAQKATEKPLLVYPNSGEGWDAVEKRWTKAPAGQPTFGQLEAWLAAGAKIVGGCCRTCPADMAALMEHKLQ